MLSDIYRAAALLHDARRILVFSGAGISAASGIATYRDDKDGLWTNPDSARFSHASALKTHPLETRRFWKERRALVEATGPNPAHAALCALQALRPNTLMVTQNVDGLLQRAGCKDVVELHGSLLRERCGANYKHKTMMLGRCLKCNGRARPDVVLFGENLDEDQVHGVFREIPGVDLLLVTGTTAQVYPAAELIPRALRFGAKVVVVDPNPPDLAGAATLVVQDAAEVALPLLVQRLRDLSA